MKRKFLSRALALALAILMSVPVIGTAAAAEDKQASGTQLSEIKELLTSVSYEEYLLRAGNGSRKGSDVVVIDAADYNRELTEITVDEYDWKALSAKLKKDFAVTLNDPAAAPNEKAREKAEAENVFFGTYLDLVLESARFDGTAVYSPAEGGITWDFEIRDPGLYNIEIEYIAIDGKSNDIERSVMIDGVYPYKEARTVSFSGCWIDAYNALSERGFYFDYYQNELRPEKLPLPEWTVAPIRDAAGYYAQPLQFYLEEGKHTLSLRAILEGMLIKSIRISDIKEAKPYEEVLADYGKKGYQPANTEPIRIDAEKPSATSDQVIYALNDRTSAITEPQDPSRILLNSIGGTKWQSSGQWIRWELDVPESGLYQIVLRFRQAEYSGVYVSRKLLIDGEVPFAEAANLKFNYSDDWQTGALGASAEEPYVFYLEKGKHTIQMEVVLGDMSEILRTIEASLLSMNKCYLKILMITGPDPDKYRDYGFEKLIPEVMEEMLGLAKTLYGISDQLARINGTKGSHSITLDKVAFILEKMGSDGDNIAENLSNLKDNIGALGTWSMTTQNQPLTLDYIQIQSASDKSLPRAKTTFWEGFIHEMRSFIQSFFSNYNSLGAMEEFDEDSNDVIDVWLTTGRDQSSIIRSMLDDFTTSSGIKVNLKLVVAGTLLPATLSGTGPDVSLTASTADCINYAIRNAVLPISDMEGFDEVKKRFADTALVPVTLYGKTYGLPETQNFTVLFYRKDIFAELDIELPRTWDELYDIIPVLQSNNLQCGFPNSLAGTTLLMYQQDEPMYKSALDPVKDADQLIAAGIDPNDKEAVGKTFGMSINLDSNVALSCFKQMCELFTMYNFPMTYDFANRFRTGEMPIAVADYTAYSQLTIFAPEINGLWEFTTLPGTATYQTDANGNFILDENGNKIIEKINNNSPSTVASTIMLRGAKGQEEAAWEFMKWWTDEPAQSRYGNELLALLGASGRHPTANIEALENQPWPSSVLKNLREQFDNLAATPEMPGGYIITRYVQFAYLDVYNNSAEPVDTLLGYIEDINKELTRKREEFGLPTREQFITSDK